MAKNFTFTFEPLKTGEFGLTKAGGAPTGKSLDESMRNFELQRDKDFTLHVCADHSRAKSQSTKHDVKQDWEKLCRAAIIDSDRSKLLQRIENAEAAIIERSRGLSKAPANSGKEQEAITRALYILSLPVTVGILNDIHDVVTPALAMAARCYMLTSGPPGTRTDEPCTGLSRWNTLPHACDLFTLE